MMAVFHLPVLRKKYYWQWRNRGNGGNSETKKFIVYCLLLKREITNYKPQIRNHIMQWIDYVGLFGAVLSSVTFVPQVIKAWQTKSVGDLSIWMVFILIANVSTWLFYGIVKHDIAIIVANSIILFLSLLMLYFKISFKK